MSVHPAETSKHDAACEYINDHLNALCVAYNSLNTVGHIDDATMPHIVRLRDMFQEFSAPRPMGGLIPWLALAIGSAAIRRNTKLVKAAKITIKSIDECEKHSIQHALARELRALIADKE